MIYVEAVKTILRAVACRQSVEDVKTILRAVACRKWFYVGFVVVFSFLSYVVADCDRSEVSEHVQSSLKF